MTPNPWGTYNGFPKTEWLPDGRRMRILEPISFVDPLQSRTWLAPENWVVDGASIPRAFWTLIGGPLEGLYRNASVFHDVACDQKSEPWRIVHRMFYHGMRCSDVPALKAKVMYYAVYHFGPRWGPPHWFRSMFSVRSRMQSLRKHLTPQDVLRVQFWVVNNDPALEAIHAHSEIVDAVAARIAPTLPARIISMPSRIARKVSSFIDRLRPPPPPPVAVGRG